MFGFFKSKRQLKYDENELNCLVEISQEYRDGKHGVTREYAMRCYNDYFMKGGAYERNRTPVVKSILLRVETNINEGDIRRGNFPSVAKTFVDYD